MITLLAALTAHAFAANDARLTVETERPLRVVIDGAEASPMIDGNGGARRVDSGRHEVTVFTQNGVALWSGQVQTPAGYDTRCRWFQRAFTCDELRPLDRDRDGVWDAASPGRRDLTASAAWPEFGVILEDILDSIPGGDGRGGRGGGVIVVPAPAPVAPSAVALVIRSLDGEWTDVRVDGRRVGGIRNEDEFSVVVSPGFHTIELMDFMDDEPYASVRVDTGLQQNVTLGIREDQAPVCYNCPGWDVLRYEAPGLY